MITSVVNIYRDEYDVYIGRAGKGQDGTFGNPFNGPDRDENIAKFTEYFFARLRKDPEFRFKVHKLKGKKLGCFCKTKTGNKACHGDIIAEYLNRLPEVKPIKLGVVGSRTFNDYEYLKSILQWFDISCIVSGGARGADALAEQYADTNRILKSIYVADWNRFGKVAGYLRNKQIVAESDEIVAFWDKKSKGTAHTIRLAEEAGKPVFVCWPTLTDDELLEFGL